MEEGKNIKGKKAPIRAFFPFSPDCIFMPQTTFLAWTKQRMQKQGNERKWVGNLAFLDASRLFREAAALKARKRPKMVRKPCFSRSADFVSGTSSPKSKEMIEKGSKTLLFSMPADCFGDYQP
ncbi:MAG: hypothetical protein PHQ50_01375 [Eubacteriales bacterium]|nr:hypothetical protein [Eubacteriales bacterium]